MKIHLYIKQTPNGIPIAACGQLYNFAQAGFHNAKPKDQCKICRKYERKHK